MSGKKINFKNIHKKKEHEEMWVSLKKEEQKHRNTDSCENANLLKRKNVKNEIHKNDYTESSEISNTEAMKRLTVDLPKDLHKIFKKVTVENDVRMVELVRQWIADYVQQK